MKNTIAKHILFFLLSFIIFHQGIADSLRVQKNRKIILIGVSGVAYSTSLVALNNAWYKSYHTGDFHFFNDNAEWLQMDKLGHAFTTYQVALCGMNSMKWAAYSKNVSTWVGGMSGSILMTGIEVLDGFSSGWGFSWGDMGANLSGSLIATVQQHVWNEQKIRLKYSYHSTSYPSYRPELLGNNLPGHILKDYNGQTYWLSINLASFLKSKNSFPKWLNLALGYGAEGMISGRPNYVIVEADGNVIGNNRYRKYYLSLDIDLSKIHTQVKWINSILKTVNILKIPSPTLEFSDKSFKGHYLFY